MGAPAASPTASAASEASRWQRMAAPVYTIGGLGLVTVALHLRDPHDRGSWGQCPSAALGLWCPGCGGLRAVNDLTNADVASAASSNFAFVVVVPFLVLGLAVWAVGRWRGRTVHVPSSVVRPVAYASLALLAVFTALRNLPAGSWLAP
jgi:Protein of unknown function (DUF2752)